MGEVMNSINPKVSVVIPVYNTEAYVREAVESILAQTLKEIEVILINDGSTDNSQRILEELRDKDPRVKLLVQKNQGLSITRNNGMEIASAQYIYFMDSDDMLEADALACCYDKCIEEKLDFVFFEADTFFDADKGSIAANFDYSRNSMTPSTVYSGMEALGYQLKAYEFRSSVCLNFIALEFLRENKLSFYPNILHEDQLFTAQLYLEASRVLYLPKVFFHRRVREDSIMTRTLSMKNMEGYFAVASELERRKEQHPQEKGAIDLLLTQMLNAAVWKAHTMPLEKRLKLLVLCVCRWKKYVSFKTCAVLLFKKTRTKQNG